MTPAQKQAVARVREDIACLEQNADYAARFGTPRSEGRERWNRNFAADLLTLLALLDEQREALSIFGHISTNPEMAVMEDEAVLRLVYDDAEWGDNTVLCDIFPRAFRRAAALTGDQP